MHIKGLLEMMFDKLAGWIDEFIADMEVGHALSALHIPIVTDVCHRYQHTAPA